MTEAIVTRQRIDELLSFLPSLDNPGSATEWQGFDQKLEDGSFMVPYPNYPPAVEEFFALASQECWCDYLYDQDQAAEMVGNDAFISAASLAQIKTMITYCVRGERFCEGHWGVMVREGRIRAILHRLRQLRGLAEAG